MHTTHTALTQFLTNLHEAQALATAITDYLEDHMHVTPEEVETNWGHAGDAGRMAMMLREIVETFSIR